jgi:hypothetical protein
MSLPIDYFQYSNFNFDINSFIDFWSKIQHMLTTNFIECEKIKNKLDEFIKVFEEIKQKKFYEFKTPEIESYILRDILHEIIHVYYEQTPIVIVKEFFKSIKQFCFIGGHGHNIFVSQPKQKALLSDEACLYKDDFYKYIADFKFYWPNHYVLDTKKYNEIKSVDLNVYLSLIAINSYININPEPEIQYWQN